MTNRFCLAAAIAMSLSGSAARAETASLSAGVAANIRVDGLLDEPAWTAVRPVPLVQQGPHPGGQSPYDTSMRVLSDRDHIYLGFTCRDPDPSQIGVHTMQRDGNMSGDDSVAFVLDTFGDQRTGYYFRVNAAGARADGLVVNQENVPLDWDGIWEARVARTADGWTAEIALPVSTLRFDPSRHAWGFNAERYVPRERHTLRWTAATLDARLADFHRAGFLEVPGFQQGIGLTVNLNSVVKRTSDFSRSHRALAGRTGLDVGYNATPQLGAVLTLNTDFAETEVDTRQINLTQFPLFFPEKRAFFLEGSNQFDFGMNLSSDLRPFYSRTIGLVEGNIVPLNAGLKILGRAGRWGIAALDAKTGEARGYVGRNLFASRISYDVDSHLRVGTLVTAGDPRSSQRNRFAGLDATWATSTMFGDKNFAAGVWAARTDTSIRGNHDGWGVAVDYPNDLWDINASIKSFGDALDPALGFLPRPATRQYSSYTAYQPRVKNSWIQQFFFEFQPRVVTDLDGRTLTWRVFTAPFNMESNSGVHLEANYAPEFERLTEPFSITDRVTIPPGAYRFDRFRVEAQSSPSRPFRAGTTIWFGTFYDGRLTQTSNFVTWTEPQGRLQLELDAENDFGHLRQGTFVQRLLQSKVIYAFSTNLIVSSYAQYDTESRQLGVNNRLRWTFRPEADLFVVWNRGWKHALFDEEARFAPAEEQLLVKLRWIFRR